MHYKSLLLLLLLTNVSIMTAQEESHDIIELKTGYLRDFDEFYVDLPEEPYEVFTNNYYNGFNYWALAFMRYRGKRRFGLEFDFYKFDIVPPVRGVDLGDGFITFPNFDRKKIQGQLTAQYGVSFFQLDRLDLYVAGLLSFAHRYEKHTSKTTYSVFTDREYYTAHESDFLAGLGTKLQGNFYVTKKIGLLFSLRLMIVDFVISKDRIEHVNLSEEEQITSDFKFDFIRGDRIAQFGLFFKL